jgi:dolichol-phosphate mannosyltransferase
MVTLLINQEIVANLSKKYNFVHLLTEKEKAGLGAAYAYGFKYAMAEINPEVLVEMDADFQHDPKDVTRLVREISHGYDYVIGSRFTRGGSIPKEWGIYRKFWSVGGNLFSKVVLGIFNVNDFTTGFKASRVRGFVDKLDLDNILSKGFAYKIDLLFKMHKLGAKIKEIPIKFGLRDFYSISPMDFKWY